MTDAQRLERQIQIAKDHEIGLMSFAAIGAEIGMGEKEVRQAYHRFIGEVAPVLAEHATVDTVWGYVRQLEAMVQRLSEIADRADNDSARVGALREASKAISKQIDLLDHFGLMPSNVADAQIRSDQEQILTRMKEVLHRHGVPPAAYEELAEIFEAESP